MTVQFITSLMTDGAMGQTQSMTGEQLMRRTDFIQGAFDEAMSSVMLTSAHGSEIAVVTDGDAGVVIENIDGFITDCPRLPLVVTHQDCVPVLVTDDRSVVAILHAGWRGVVAGILPNAILLAAEEFGVPASKLRIHLGPGIRPCHFVVSSDVAEQFPSSARIGDAIDLHAALRQQAENFGVSLSSITVDGRCTVCTENNNHHVFASWRRDKVAGNNMISVAMLD